MAEIIKLPRAPMYYITERAAQVFHDFYADTGSRGVPIADAAQMLSDALASAHARGAIVDVRDSNHSSEVSKVALVDARAGVKCYVVLRHFRRNSARVLLSPSGAGGFGAITCVSERTGSQCFADQSWTPLINRPFDKLADVGLPEPQPRKTSPGIATALNMALEQSDQERATPRAPSTPRHEADLRIVDAQDTRRSEASRAAAAKLPDGWRSHAARMERIAFAREVFRERPHIRLGSADGLDAMLDAKFGVGVSGPILEQVRAEVLAEAGSQVPRVASPPPRDDRAVDVRACRTARATAQPDHGARRGADPRERGRARREGEPRERRGRGAGCRGGARCGGPRRARGPRRLRPHPHRDAGGAWLTRRHPSSTPRARDSGVSRVHTNPRSDEQHV